MSGLRNHLRFEEFYKMKKGMASLFLFSIIYVNTYGRNFIINASQIKPKYQNSKLETRNLTHAFHTSITQIEYNPKNKIFEVSVRIFSDDLAKAIDVENKTKNTKIEDEDNNEKIVFNYLANHFSIVSPQNKKIPFKFLGKENEDLATWIYLEIPSNALAKGSKIQQNVLMELYDDQVNIMNIKSGEERKSILFDIKNKLKIFE